MSFVHGRVQSVKLSGVDASLTAISSYLESAKGDTKSDRPDVTTFGQAAIRRTVLGKRAFSLGLSGLYQPAAATKIHGRQTNIMFGSYAMHAYLMKGSVKRKVSLDETSTLGDDWEEHGVVGLMDGDISFDGLFDSTATSGVDAQFRAAMATATPYNVSIGYGGFAIGSICDMSQVVQGSMSVGGDKASTVPISGSFNSDDVIDAGVSLHASGAETTTVNSASVDFSASSTNALNSLPSAVAHLHVSAFASLTSCVIRVEHSTDDSSFAALLTFATVTAVGSDRKETALNTTTVNRYIRSAISTFTGSGSVTYVVTFARRGYANATWAPAGTHQAFAALLPIVTEPTFEYGPEGSASGARKLSGSCRVESYDVTFDKGGITKQSVNIVGHGATAEGTY